MYVNQGVHVIPKFGSFAPRMSFTKNWTDEQQQSSNRWHLVSCSHRQSTEMHQIEHQNATNNNNPLSYMYHSSPISKRYSFVYVIAESTTCHPHKSQSEGWPNAQQTPLVLVSCHGCDILWTLHTSRPHRTGKVPSIRH